MSSEYTVVEDSKQPHGTVYRWHNCIFCFHNVSFPIFADFFSSAGPADMSLVTASGGHAEDRTLLNCTMTTRDVLLTPFSVIQLIASFVITFVLNFLIAYYTSEGTCSFDPTPSTPVPCRRVFTIESINKRTRT